MLPEKHELTDEAWTDLGPAPLLLQTVSSVIHPVPAGVLFLVAPAGSVIPLDAPAFELGLAPHTETLTGNVYARAVNGRGATIVVAR